MATRPAQIIQAETHTEHIPGWESEDGTLVTSIPSNEYHILSYHYLIIGPLHHLQPHLFQEKGTGASGVVSHLPICDAMQCNAATSPLVQRTPCHLPALRLRWAERFWPGRVGRKRGAGRFVTANPNKQSRCLRPTCQLLDLLQTKNINSWQWDLVYKCLKLCKSGFLRFSKKNDALCVTCWFGKLLLRHIHFSKHIVTLPKPLQWPPQKRVALSPHADIVPWPL